MRISDWSSDVCSSDLAMPSVGSDAATFELQGRTIRREGDILRGADGVLAGSTLTMAGAVANMIAQGRVSLRTAVTMASATPAAFLGLADRTGRPEGRRVGKEWVSTGRARGAPGY